jgi:glucose-1-phosphate cytidylyltransferase
MKIVILAGGLGTRISEESHLKPKPMIEIGEIPLLVHIMRHYSSQGFNDFIICLGYKGNVIKEYFNNYYLYRSDVSFKFNKFVNEKSFLNCDSEDWNIKLIDTGLNTMTGGRLNRIKKYLDNDTFMLTYGDGISNVNLFELLGHHREKRKLLTLTAVQPQGRWGVVDVNNDDIVNSFNEKSKNDVGYINGGFMCVEPEVLNYCTGDNTIFENEVLTTLVKNREVTAYKHHGFWHSMDTLRDKNQLEEIWNKNNSWNI